jgi:quercetin dioxygenase-like cupin family protein
MRSTIYDWTQITPEPTNTGQKRPFFRVPTDTLDLMTCHVTTLNPGEAAHAPHRHPEEEMIIVKEGKLDVLHDGQTKPMSAGSVLLIASNDLHGVRNPGPGPASYFVIKWFVGGKSG